MTLIDYFIVVGALAVLIALAIVVVDSEFSEAAKYCKELGYDYNMDKGYCKVCEENILGQEICDRYGHQIPIRREAE